MERGRDFLEREEESSGAHASGAGHPLRRRNTRWGWPSSCPCHVLKGRRRKAAAATTAPRVGHRRRRPDHVALQKRGRGRQRK
jgi:hypothetical protein